MNRSILIVICDFLLVSLIAFSNFDSLTPDSADVIDTSAGNEAARSDMVSALKIALEDESQSRQQLATELSQTRQAIQTQQEQLTERESKIQQFQENLRQTESQAKRLEQERGNLQQQVAAAQTNLQSLRGTVLATRSEAQLTAAQLQAVEANLRKRQEENDALQRRLAEVELSRSNVLAAQQELNSKLQVVETEKRLTAEQLAGMRSEVQTVRAEKAEMQATTAKLAEGVSALADKSGVLAQEIRENRPLAANTIFKEFNDNRIETQFVSTRGGALGQDVKREKSTQTVLVSDGSQTYAIYHVNDTPLTLWPRGTEWRELSAVLSRGYYSYKVGRLGFLAQDPRVVVAPIDAEQARGLGGKIYKIAKDPFKFADAVLVGVNEGYYGECKFQIDLTTPQYVKMDRGLFRGLFGKFNPSRGDLVLSKTGEVLGIMVNNQYCAVLDKITPGQMLNCGDALVAQDAGKLLDSVANRILTLPIKLQ